MNIKEFFVKVRDNAIPTSKLYNKFFVSDKVASLLLKTPLSVINGETALLFLMNQNRFSKHTLLKQFAKQTKYELRIREAMRKFRVYDPNTKKHVQTIHIKYGVGIEYLLLGEILERDYGFHFDQTPEQIRADGGRELCSQIEQVVNRIGDYFKTKDKDTLKAIKQMVKEQQLAKKIAEENE